MQRKRISGMAFIVLSFFALALAIPVQAAKMANPGLLLDAKTVKANIGKPDWVVVDARALKDYVAGHIPGAISLGKRGKKVLRDSTARVLQDVSKYETLFSKAGIGNDTHVVFYHGDMKTLNDATIGFWVMEYLGHDKVYLLDGGIDAWRNAGERLDKTPTMKPAKTFKAAVVASRIAPTAEILDIANGKITNVTLIDSRTKKEHEGKDIRALRGGHVPNTTINVPHLDTLKKVLDKKTGKKKATAYIDTDALEKAFGGFDKSRRTVAYCQTGTRSTLTYLQLRLMGFKEPANWDESWRVWGTSLANYPVEAPNGVQYYNFDKVNKSLKKLDKKVKAIEDLLKAGHMMK